MDPSKSRPPLTVQEFLSIIRGDPRPEASAAFVDAVRGDRRAGPDVPLFESGRPAAQVSREDWLSAVNYGIHGPTDPDFAGDLREHNFRPDEARDEKGRWTTDGSQDSRRSPFRFVSDPPHRSKSGAIWISSDKLTWDNFKGAPPPPEKRQMDGGVEAKAETVTGIQPRKWKPISKAESVQKLPSTAKQRGTGGGYRATATAPGAEVHAVMDQGKSWALESARTDLGLLQHERYHVRITEAAAAMATKRLRDAVGIGVADDPISAQNKARQDLESQREQIHAAENEWLGRSQKYYDDETKHGSDPVAQAEMERQIDQHLARARGQ
jgi:hypothetical protein